MGALLQIADHPSGKTYLPTYAGNGNIAALLNADTGDLAAAYEYSPYGEPLRSQTLDPTVADNPFRFSTKYTDLETGLIYYGHRFYNPKNGRFINRDPIEESGGLNLYGFVLNNPVNRWDYLGMACMLVESTDYLPDEHGEWRTRTTRDWVCNDVPMLAPFEVKEERWTDDDEDNHQRVRSAEVDLRAENPGYGDPSDGGGGGSDDPYIVDDEENKKKEKEDKKKICGELREARSRADEQMQAARSQWDRRAAYHSKVATSFGRDNGDIVRGTGRFVGEMIPDVAGAFVPEAVGEIGGALIDSVPSGRDDVAAIRTGLNIALATYYTTNYLRPTIYRGRGFARIVRVGGPVLLVGSVLSSGSEHLVAPIRNEIAQNEIMKEGFAELNELKAEYAKAESAWSAAQRKYNDLGCSNVD